MSIEASGKSRVKFVANPTQRVFIENRPGQWLIRPDDWDDSVKPQVVDLFSCRMGEGKSAALCWAVWFYTKHNPGAACVLIRDTWENMRDTTMVEFMKWFSQMGKMTKSEKKFVWTARGMSGSVTFMGMDDEKDAHKLQSREFGFMGMDEPSPAAGTGGIDHMIFTTALTRLRQPGMNWYAAKLAQNNPDESHWTFLDFVDPGTPGYTHFQTAAPENEKNLPPGYYKEMEKNLAGREDLKRRFVKGEFGFQQLGVPVCPNWNDSVHLAEGLEPMSGVDLIMSWDGGLNPTCTISQLGPSGFLYVLECIMGEGIGTYQLVEDVVYPRLEERYAKWSDRWWHTGDPTLGNREQSDSNQSAVKVIKKTLGGRWRPGAKDISPGIEPLNKRLSMLYQGRGMVQVDKHLAKPVHYALRGGWHYPKHSGGVVGVSPVKNHPHSDVGDTMRYLASVLFPMGKLKRKRGWGFAPGQANYDSMSTMRVRSFVKEKTKIPEEFREVG